jgi:hypothetical protein
MELNFQDWGTIAEIFGALAVIVSLLYVGVQIKQNNRINRGIAIQKSYASTQEAYSWVVNNSHVHDLAVKFLQGERLTIPEFTRMSTLWMGILEGYEVYFILNKLKMIDEETFYSFFRKIILALGTPSARQWFTRNSTFFRRDFVEFVNNFLDGNPKMISEFSRFLGQESEPV